MALLAAIAVDLRVALVVASRVVRAAGSHEERAAAFTAAVDTGKQTERTRIDPSDHQTKIGTAGSENCQPFLFLMPRVVIPAARRFPFSELN